MINFICHEEKIWRIKGEFAKKSESNNPDASILDLLEFVKHSRRIPRVKPVRDQKHDVINIVTCVDIVKSRLDPSCDVRKTTLPRLN